MQAKLFITSVQRTTVEPWDWIITCDIDPGVSGLVYFEEDIEQEVESLAEWIIDA